MLWRRGSETDQRLARETDAIVQLTTGGSPRLPVDERLTTVLLAPEMCSLNMGLLNLHFNFAAYGKLLLSEFFLMGGKFETVRTNPHL